MFLAKSEKCEIKCALQSKWPVKVMYALKVLVILFCNAGSYVIILFISCWYPIPLQSQQLGVNRASR